MKNEKTNEAKEKFFIRYCAKHDWHYVQTSEEYDNGEGCPICSDELVPSVNFLRKRKLNLSDGEEIHYIG